MAGIIPNGPKDFPRIAKEMGFSFSLRRGRVDWQKIGAIDVDRLVQERDLVSLQENLISIINYNLDSEYDVKILDPNFVKLFKLAQLSIDYLLYSEQHFYNCIELEQQQMKKYTKEIEKLKREYKKKDEEVKDLKKKLNEIQWHQQHLRTGRGEGVSNFFKCSHCGKTFLTAGYLEAHHMRRHPGIMFMQLPNQMHSETERLQSEIKELKERLNNTERLLHKESGEAIKEKQEDVVRGEDWAEEKRQMEEQQQAQQRKYLNEIADLKTIFHNEIKRLKESSQQLTEPTAATNAELLEQIHKQDEELASLRERLNGQSIPDMESMQSRLEAQERFWKSRLKQMEAAHERQLEGLRVQLDQVKESHDSSRYTEYESNIQQLMAHAARQDEMLKAQAIQILTLTEQCSGKMQQTDDAHWNGVELQPQRRRDPSATFTELTARIDKVVRDGINTKQLTQSSVRRQAKSPHSVSQTSVSVKNIPSPTERRGFSQSPKQSVVVTNITTETKNSTDSLKVDHQEESSSDSSPRTLNIRTQATSMYGFIDQELHTSDKGTSPQGSKDSGLDSPKRFSTTPIKKLNAFQGLSIKSTPVTSGSEDRVDSVNEMTESDDGGREGEGKEEETISDEATRDETETEMDTDTEPAVKSVLSLENALQQNPQILSVLKDDLRDLHARKLREIGVDPEWKGIPAATFQQKMATLKHHQTITAKRHKSFFKIKQRLSDELDRYLSSSETNRWRGNVERAQQRGSTQQGKVAIKKFAGKGKIKAVSVLKRSKGNLSTHSANSSQKDTNQDKADVSLYEDSSPTHKEQTQNIDIMNKGEDTKFTGSNAMSGTLATVKKFNARSAEQSTAPPVTMITSTPLKNGSTGTPAIFARRSILKGGKSSSVSELVHGNKSVKNPSISHVEDDLMEEEEESDDVSDGDAMEQAITHMSSQSSHQSEEPYGHKDKNPNSTSYGSQAAAGNLSSGWESPKGNKSALKTQPSSLGSITKKRVLFVDQENELASHKEQENDNSHTNSLPWNASRTVVTSGLSHSVKTLGADPLSSWDSSPLTSPNKSINLKTQSSTRNSDSDSDWGLSSSPISVEQTGPAGSYQQINLSTKQSDKIAQISKSIEKQLSMSRSKPPAGSVEAMLHASGGEKSFHYEGMDDSSASDSNHENNMNLNNTNTTSAPVPKPRSKQPTPGMKETSLKHSLSDWDLEDFDD